MLAFKAGASQSARSILEVPTPTFWGNHTISGQPRQLLNRKWKVDGGSTALYAV